MARPKHNPANKSEHKGMARSPQKTVPNNDPSVGFSTDQSGKCCQVIGLKCVGDPDKKSKGKQRKQENGQSVLGG